jgi:hypothetical protein
MAATKSMTANAHETKTGNSCNEINNIPIVGNQNAASNVKFTHFWQQPQQNQ